MVSSKRPLSVNQANRLAIRDAFLARGVTHLHYMAPLRTMGLIAAAGIISYNIRQRLARDPEQQKMMRDLGCESLADPNVQFRRDRKAVFGRNLHDYVPLYIGRFTPMQYVVTKNNFEEQGQRIVFAEVSVEKVFELEGVCYSDGNAASNATRFYNDPSGLEAIEWDIVLHENRCWGWEWKRWKMAEVLVPDQIPPECIEHYVLKDSESAEEFCEWLDELIERDAITHTDFTTVWDQPYFYRLVGGSLIPND